MKCEWESAQLGSLLLEPQRNGLSRPKKDRGNGLPMVNMGELFANHRIKNIEMDLVPVNLKEKHFILETGDLLFARQSLVLSGAGKCSIFLENNEPTVFESHLIRCRLDKTKSNPLYYFYFFSSSEGRRVIEQIVEQGAGASGIRGSDLVNLFVPIPPKDTQDKIANLLNALDDRITLLRETNTTLEAIAQALFKSWFIDFDPVHAKMQGQAPQGMDEATAALFPDSFEESELGPIPKGWAIKPLKHFCERVESGGTPKRNQPEYWDGQIYWLSSGEVRNPIILTTKERITHSGLKNSSAKLWPSGTTVVAMYGATAGEVCLLAEAVSANQACCGLIPKEGFRSFLYLTVMGERVNLASKSSGSAQQNLNKGLVEGHTSILPHPKVVLAFEAICGELINKRIENTRRTETLSAIRDQLLPRLISGQLEISEVNLS